MKSRFLFFAVICAAFAFLYKHLVDTQEKMLLMEAELHKLQREKAAREQAYAEAAQEMQQFEDDHPLPDDPDKKLRVAMLDAIYSAKAKETLGDNHVDYEEDEEDDS